MATDFSVLAAIFLPAVGLSGPQLPQARNRSSQKYNKLVPRHASKNFPSPPLHPLAIGPSSLTPTLTTRATRRKSLPTPFDVFCFRVRVWARQTAKCCFAAPYYHYLSYRPS
ncbi:hypothetical protein EDB89DRAFT_1954567 [Lactarius sanguifluus]|nr:hypothetical protein EDB89DRAFT_1954567 [Lactarius sanguifluus]